MSETETLDARADVIRLTFRAEHPKAVDAVVVHVDGATYKVTTEGACFRADLLDGGVNVAFTLADPADVSVNLAPSVLRRLVGPPEVAPVPVLGLDPAIEIRRALDLLDRLRVVGESARIALRGVEPDVAAEVERLRGLAPTDAHDVQGRPLSVEGPLLRMVQEVAEARATVSTLDRLVHEARDLVRDLRPRVTALADATIAKKPDRLRDLPGLGLVGEMHRARVSDHAQKLDALDESLDRIGRAVAEVAPVLALFVPASERYAVAALTVAREVGARTRAAWLDSVRPLAVKLRMATATEMLAESTCMGLDVSTVPRLVYGPDLLAAPTLETRNGERP